MPTNRRNLKKMDNKSDTAAAAARRMEGTTNEIRWEQVVEEARESVVSPSKSGNNHNATNNNHIDTSSINRHGTIEDNDGDADNDDNDDGSTNSNQKQKRSKRKRKNRKRSDSEDHRSASDSAETEERPTKRLALETVNKETMHDKDSGDHHPDNVSPPNHGASTDKPKATSLRKNPPLPPTTPVPPLAFNNKTSSRGKRAPTGKPSNDNIHHHDQGNTTLPSPPTFLRRQQQDSPPLEQPQLDLEPLPFDDPTLPTDSLLQRHAFTEPDLLLDDLPGKDDTQYLQDLNDVDFLLQQQPVVEPWYRIVLPSLHRVMIWLCWFYVVAMVTYGVYQLGGLRVQVVRPFLRMPLVTCFRNNVHSPVPYQGVCAHADPTTFVSCPKHALCWGGVLHDCRFGGSMERDDGQGRRAVSYFFEVTGGNRNKQCHLTDSVSTIFAGITNHVEKWTMAQTCGSNMSQNKFPEPTWWHVSDENHSRPMFVLTDATKQLALEQQNAPFRVDQSDDALQFIRTVTQELEDKHNIFLSSMPHVGRPSPWLGGRMILSPQSNHTSNNQVPPGTPLIGLNDTQSWRKWWLPLSVQCHMNGMPQALVKVSTNQSAMEKLASKQNASAMESKGIALANVSKVPKSQSVARVNATLAPRSREDNSTVRSMIVGATHRIASSIRKLGMNTKNTTMGHKKGSSTQQKGSVKLGSKTVSGMRPEAGTTTWTASTRIYFLVSLTGFIFILYIRLRGAVQRGVASSEQVIPQERQNIWPSVVGQLQTDPHAFDSTSISPTTGQAQTAFSWRKFVEASEDTTQTTTSPKQRPRSPKKTPSPTETTRRLRNKTTIQVAYQG
jgi:hypothetical protein